MSVYEIDDRWRAEIATGGTVFPNLITMRSAGIVVSESGQNVPDSTPDAITGLTGLACRMTPIVKDRPTGKEQREAPLTTYFEGWHITINGYYPTITVGMIADVDGKLMDIESVQWDGHHTHTRLRTSERKD